LSQSGQNLFAPQIDRLGDVRSERNADGDFAEAVARCEAKKLAQSFDALVWSAGDDQAIHGLVRSERSCDIDTAILGVGLAHRLDRLRVDAFGDQRFIRPARSDVGDKTLGVLARGFAIA
jgi:hypothetical protein